MVADARDALCSSADPLPPTLANEEHDASLAGPEIGTSVMDEATFRDEFEKDVCGRDKLDEGLSSFIDLTEQLEGVIKAKVDAALIELTRNNI